MSLNDNIDNDDLSWAEFNSIIENNVKSSDTEFNKLVKDINSLFPMKRETVKDEKKKTKSRSKGKKSGEKRKSSEKRDKINLKSIIDSLIKSNDIDIDANVQSMFFTHMISLIILDQKYQVTLNAESIKSELNNYVKNNRGNIENMMFKFINQMSNNISRV